MSNKILTQTVMGIGATAVNLIFGEWSPMLTSLFILMITDIVTGLLSAAFVHVSKYGDGISSKALYSGALRKCLMLIMIVVGAQMDVVLELDFVRSSVIAYLTMLELVSVVENVTRAGVPVPDFIKKLLDTETKKFKEEKKDD